MRGKSLLWTSLISALVLSLLTVGWVNASPLTKLEISPSSLGTIYPGDIVTIDVNVVNVVGLNSWEVVLRMSSFVVQPQSAEQGPFLSESGPAMFLYSVGQLKNYIRLGESGLTPTVLGTGSGTLATVTLKAVGGGSCSLELTETKLLDVSMKPMAHSTYDGQVSVHALVEVTGRWEDRQRHSISTDGDINTLYGKAANLGEIGDIDAYVEFIAFAKDGQMIKLDSDVVTIGSGEEVVLSAGFNATYWGEGKYEFITRAWYFIEGWIYRGAKAKILSFVVTS